MFTIKEITYIGTIISQLQYKVGQEDDYKLAGSIVKKCKEYLLKQTEVPKEKNETISKS